jgi:transcriptional regulator with XRE-family HTH domain
VLLRKQAGEWYRVNSVSETRILRINLKRPIERALANMTRAELAKAIGISRPKLNAILKEEWDYITRDAIERIADYFQLGVSDVFEFFPVPFWKPIEDATRCTFLRGSHDAKAQDSRDITVPYFDSLSTVVVERFLREHAAILSDTPYADHLRDVKDILDRAMRENCIVIGSPQTNAATEILLSRFFDAEPFEPSTSNRRKIPFGFCWAEGNKIAGQSSLTCSGLAKEQLSGQAGIALQGGYQVRADFLPPPEFKAWQTNQGMDCGLVFVANKPFRTTQNVKLIVLAGLHGIGTLAAATALVEDFRYLEPLEDEQCVFGVVEARYSKQKNSMDRTYRGFAWRHRQGGSSPILHGESKRKIPQE